MTDCSQCETQCRSCKEQHHQSMEVKHWQEVEEGMMQIPVRLAHVISNDPGIKPEIKRELRGWFKDL